MALQLNQTVFDFEIYDNKKICIAKIHGTPVDVINKMKWTSFQDIHDYTITIREYNDIMQVPEYTFSWFGKEKKSKYPFGYNPSVRMKDYIKYLAFKPLLSGKTYAPYLERLENRMLSIADFRQNLDGERFESVIKQCVDSLGMIEIKSYDELLSDEPCVFLLVYDKYHQAREGYVDDTYSLLQHIKWRIKGKVEQLTWLKYGEYDITDITRIYIKRISIESINADEIKPNKSDLKQIQRDAKEMYEADLEDTELEEEERFDYDQCYKLAYEDWLSTEIAERKREIVHDEYYKVKLPSEYRFEIPNELSHRLMKYYHEDPDYYYSV